MPNRAEYYLMPWASYQIRKIAGCACAGNAGNVFPRHRLQRKPLVNDPGMHHGTCVTHVPWCMSGSLTHCGGENVPGIPGACATRNFTYLVRGPWWVGSVTRIYIYIYIYIYIRTQSIDQLMEAEWRIDASVKSAIIASDNVGTKLLPKSMLVYY